MIDKIKSLIGLTGFSDVFITSVFAFIALLFPATFVTAKRLLRCKTEDYGREFFLEALTLAGRPVEKLKLAIVATLNLLDRIIGDDYFKKHHARIGWKSLDPRSDHSPLTFKSFQTCVALAIIYPLIILMIIYMITGQGKFAYWDFSDGGLSFFARLAFMSGIVLCYVAGRSIRLRIERSRFSEKTKDWFIAVAIIFAGVFAIVGDFVIGFTSIVAFAGAFAIAFSVAFTVAFTVAVVLPGAIAFAFAGFFAGFFAGVFAGVGIIVLGRRLGRHLHRSHGGRIKVLLGGAVYLLAQVIFLQFADYSIAKRGVNTYLELLVPLLFLPLVNAVFDWFSLAATRLLLATHLKLDSRPKRLLLIFADIGLALALVPTLLIAVIATLQALESLGVGTNIDLATIITSLTTPAASLAEYLERNAQYLWVFGMLLTTLVPTLIHFLFALCTLATQTLYLLPFLRTKIDDFVAERKKKISQQKAKNIRSRPAYQGNQKPLPPEEDAWMRFCLPLFIALAVCLFIGLLIVPYLLLHALIDPGIIWYGELLKEIALSMI
jgi:hypothetical protein